MDFLFPIVPTNTTTFPDFICNNRHQIARANTGESWIFFLPLSIFGRVTPEASSATFGLSLGPATVRNNNDDDVDSLGKQNNFCFVTVLNQYKLQIDSSESIDERIVFVLFSHLPPTPHPLPPLNSRPLMLLNCVCLCLSACVCVCVCVCV